MCWKLIFFFFFKDMIAKQVWAVNKTSTGVAWPSQFHLGVKQSFAGKHKYDLLFYYFTLFIKHTKIAPLKKSHTLISKKKLLRWSHPDALKGEKREKSDAWRTQKWEQVTFGCWSSTWMKNERWFTVPNCIHITKKKNAFGEELHEFKAQKPLVKYSNGS